MRAIDKKNGGKNWRNDEENFNDDGRPGVFS